MMPAAGIEWRPRSRCCVVRRARLTNFASLGGHES